MHILEYKIHILDAVYFWVLQLAKQLALRGNDVGLQSTCKEATICHQAHIALHSSRNLPFWFKSACTVPDGKEMKGHKEKISDTPTHKWQKTGKEQEVPNSLLSLPKDILQYCISFVRKGHYQYVGSVCKQINKIYANDHEDIKKTFGEMSQ
jgi:hypothetical protein